MTEVRKQMIADALQSAGADAPITVEHIARFLPDDFELEESDLAEFQPAEAEPVAQPFDWAVLKNRADVMRANGAAPEVQEPEAVAEPAPVQPGDIEAATERRIKSISLVANARNAVLAATNVEREARTRLAAAVTQFQSGFASRPTPEQLRRDHVKEQQAIRAGIKDGAIEPPRYGVGVGKSVVDRIAYAQRGGSHNNGNFRRGASTIKGAPNFDPRKGPVAKLPSQR
jgi:hypothetical protein